MQKTRQQPLFRFSNLLATLLPCMVRVYLNDFIQEYSNTFQEK